jgi:cobalt-precorrin 5A hydrolase
MLHERRLSAFGAVAVVAGIGCRRDCDAAAIVALVRAAEAAAACRADRLAAPDFKQGELGLRSAADWLGLPLTLVAWAAIAAVQSNCATRAAAAQRVTGLASVAEGVALAAAGPGARLVLARIAAGGATCALASDDS